jgi:hypothetical protein
MNARRTCRREENRHFEALALNNVRARAFASGRKAAGDGVNTMQSTGHDKVLIRCEFRESLYEPRIVNEVRVGPQTYQAPAKSR